MKWTFQRLVEILNSIPERRLTQRILSDTGRAFDRKLAKSPYLKEKLRRIAESDESPHYRELAAEALQWLAMEPKP